MLIVALVMMGIALFGFVQGTCPVKGQWAAWPTLISKPMRVAKAWKVLAWDETAIAQLLGMLAGVSVVSPNFQIRSIMQHATTAWKTFWST